MAELMEENPVGYDFACQIEGCEVGAYIAGTPQGAICYGHYHGQCEYPGCSEVGDIEMAIGRFKAQSCLDHCVSPEWVRAAHEQRTRDSSSG